MKIAYVTIQYPPTIGGLQEHIKGIVSLAISLGHSVSVLTSAPNPTMKTEGKVDNNVIELPVIKWFKDAPIINPVKLYRTLKELNPDVVHVVYPLPILLEVTCIYAKLKRKKLVCTYIDDITVGFPINKMYEATLWKLSKKLIDSMSVSSKTYANSAAGLKDWKNGFFEIPPPVFDTDFNLSIDVKHAARKRLRLQEYRRVVLFVGGLRKKLRYKKLESLLRAWAEYLKMTKDNSVLVIIGDGELREHYESEAHSLGLTPNDTQFWGYISRQKLLDCYLAGNVLVLPSQGTNEAFGIVSVEAMLYGNAVIGSAIPGITGALTKGEGAQVALITPSNHEEIVHQLQYWLSKEWTDYACGNNEYVKEYFSKENIAGELRRMYEEV